MKSRRISGIPAVYALVFDKGDRFPEGLRKFAADKGVFAAHFTGIGAFEEATLGYFDRGPTLEVIVTETPAHLRRRHDPETGLALIDLDEAA
jgi:predicted DNA-binding protein with PD1-like motif